MGVPLIPGRAGTRSRSTRWSSGSSNADTAQRQLVRGIAALSVAALAVTAVIGSTPVPAAITVAMLVPAAVIDIEQRRLPDVWVGAALFALAAALVASWSVGQPADSTSVVTAVIGGSLAMALPVLSLHVVSPTSMGFGDVKAAGVLGAAVGTIDWRLGAVALCVAALIGASVGLAMRQRTIAFGPFLVCGAWITLLANDPIVDSIFAAGGPA